MECDLSVKNMGQRAFFSEIQMMKYSEQTDYACNWNYSYAN